MKLRKEEITKIAGLILRQLKEHKNATLRGTETQVLERIEAVFQKNLEEEISIENEVRRLMDQHKTQVSSDAVDAQRAYQMIRKQIAKDRKFIL